MVFKWCGDAFHSVGPRTANYWSNRVWLAAELDRLLKVKGMTDKFLIWPGDKLDVKVIHHCWSCHEELSTCGGR